MFSLQEHGLSTLFAFSQISRQFYTETRSFLDTLYPKRDYTLAPDSSPLTLGCEWNRDYAYFRGEHNNIYSSFYTDFFLVKNNIQNQLCVWSLKDTQDQFTHKLDLNEKVEVVTTTPQGDTFLMQSIKNFIVWDLESSQHSTYSTDALHRIYKSGYTTKAAILLPDKKTVIKQPSCSQKFIEGSVFFSDISTSGNLLSGTSVNVSTIQQYLTIYKNRPQYSQEIRQIIATPNGKYFIPIFNYLADGLNVWNIAEKTLYKTLLPVTTEKPVYQELLASVSHDSKWFSLVYRDSSNWHLKSLLTNRPTTCLQWRLDAKRSTKPRTFELQGIENGSELKEIAYTRDNMALLGLLRVFTFSKNGAAIRIWSATTGQCLYHFFEEYYYDCNLLLPSTGEILIVQGYGAIHSVTKLNFPLKPKLNILEKPNELPSKTREKPLRINFNRFFNVFIFSAVVSLISILLTLTLESPLISLLKLFNFTLPLQGAALLATTAAVFFGAAFLVGVAIACIASAINSCRTSEKADEVILTTTKNDALSKNNTAILQTIGHHFTALFKPSLEENAKKGRTAPKEKQTSSIPHRTNFFM